MWSADCSGGVAAQTPEENTLRLKSREGIVILSRGFCGEGPMDLLAAPMTPGRRSLDFRKLVILKPAFFCWPKDLLFAATIGAVAMNCFEFGRITAKRPEKFFPQSVTVPACDLDHGLSSRNGKPCTIAACCFLPRKPMHTSNHAPTT